MNPLAQAVLGYCLNSVWQVPLIALAALPAARWARRGGPELEHRVWVSALVFEALLPACALRPGEVWAATSGWLRQSSGSTSVHVVTGAVQSRTHELSWMRIPGPLAGALLVLYLTLVALALLRLLAGLWQTSRLMLEAETTWLDVQRTAGVRVCCSERLPGPATVGAFAPMILLPAKLAQEISAADLDAVLAHEIAHVRRRDYAWNLVYCWLALPVAYHPLLWWTRARLAGSREMVCDRVAAEQTAGPIAYGRSLLRLAALVGECGTLTNAYAIGIFDANTLERRIEMLTESRQEVSAARRVLLAGGCVAMALLTGTSALAWRVSPAVSGLRVQATGPQLARVSGGVMAGNVLTKQMPIYPAEAKASHNTVDGAVVLRVIIDKEGVAQEVTVQQSLRQDYDASALEAVKSWRWKPFLLNGEPTEVDTTVTVTYTIGN